MSEVKYGNTVLALATIPEASALALIQRGFSHVLGNEVASKVTAAKKTAEEAGDPMDEKTIADLTEQFRKEMLDKIMAGTLGVRVGGPRGTALETIMRTVAVERLKANFKKAKMTWPKKAEDKVNVSGEMLTRSEVIERYLAKNEASLKEEAERRQTESEADAEDLAELI